MTIEKKVNQALRAAPCITDVRLVGSRKEGRAVPLSDWDFEVDTTDVEEVAQEPPLLLMPLNPVYRLWDPLTQGPPWNYIVMLGPVIIDLHFQWEHQPEPPWQVSASTLQDIDTHFWDWVLYMAKKQMKGETLLIGRELHKMHWFLLSPMGTSEQPSAIEEAITGYVSRRSAREAEFGIELSLTVQHEVVRALRLAGIQLPNS